MLVAKWIKFLRNEIWKDVYFLSLWKFMYLLFYFYFRYKDSKYSNICSQDICWEAFIYPLSSRYEGIDKDQILVQVLLVIVILVGFLVFLRPWWYILWSKSLLVTVILWFKVVNVHDFIGCVKRYREGMGILKSIGRWSWIYKRIPLVLKKLVQTLACTFIVLGLVIKLNV